MGYMPKSRHVQVGAHGQELILLTFGHSRSNAHGLWYSLTANSLTVGMQTNVCEPPTQTMIPMGWGVSLWDQRTGEHYT